MTSHVFCVTRQNLAVMAYEFGQVGPRVLLLGGVHGDEIEGVWCARQILGRIKDQFPWRLRMTLIPEFNIEGVLLKQRQNSAGVDLNRNLPTKDWTAEWTNPRYKPGPTANSEPENQSLTAWIEAHQPELILSLHSWNPLINVNGNCLEEAHLLAEKTGYKIEADMGYPTPGCLGTYAGIERNSPTITYEIERGLDAHSIARVHVPAILECLRATERKHASKANS